MQRINYRLIALESKLDEFLYNQSTLVYVILLIVPDSMKNLLS